MDVDEEEEKERGKGTAGLKVENGPTKSHERTIKALPANQVAVTAGRGDNNHTGRTDGPGRCCSGV